MHLGAWWSQAPLAVWPACCGQMSGWHGARGVLVGGGGRWCTRSGGPHTVMLCVGGGVPLGVSMEMANSRITGSLSGWKRWGYLFWIFFSKQIPRATTAGWLSNFTLRLPLFALLLLGIRWGCRVAGKEGETSVGKSGSQTRSQCKALPT